MRLPKLRRIAGFSLAGTAAMLLSACIPVMTDPTVFNRALEPEEAVTDRPSCLSSKGGYTCVLQGMKLVIIESDARDHSKQDRTMVESRTEWIVPSFDHFSQEDLFHLSWLLSISTATGRSLDASRCYQEWLRSDLYPVRFRREFLKPLLESLQVRYTTGELTGPGNGYATDIQRWMRDLPEKADMESVPIIEPRQKITFTLPLAPGPATEPGTPSDCVQSAERRAQQYEALAGGSVFQREVGDKPSALANAGGWYGGGSRPTASRAFVLVEIPITVRGSLGVQYVPIDSTLSGSVEALGLHASRLVGVIRDARLIPTSDVPQSHQSDLHGDRILITVTDGQNYFPSQDTLSVSRSVLDQMLVAPGDRLIIR